MIPFLRVSRLLVAFSVVLASLVLVSLAPAFLVPERASLMAREMVLVSVLSL